MHFIFPHFLLIEGYGKYALCKEPVIATFAERLKLYKAIMIYFILQLRAICLTISFFLDFLLIEDYQQGALRKEPVTAPIIERAKIAILRKCY